MGTQRVTSSTRCLTSETRLSEGGSKVWGVDIKLVHESWKRKKRVTELLPGYRGYSVYTQLALSHVLDFGSCWQQRGHHVETKRDLLDCASHTKHENGSSLSTCTM
eukprot:scaffold315630_cov22-Tisochrysis_lutea.AAC.1